MGSAPYISPEQVLGVRSDPRSDIFALGAVLYELATGELPFGSPTSPSGLRRRLHEEPVPPRARNPAVPEWLQEVILHCLEPDARRRYASAAQVAFDLTHADQVAVGDRGRRLRRAGLATRFRRWFKAKGMEPAEVVQPSAHLASAPIVLAAVATRHGNEVLFHQQRDVVARLMAGRQPDPAGGGHRHPARLRRRGRVGRGHLHRPADQAPRAPQALGRAAPAAARQGLLPRPRGERRRGHAARLRPRQRGGPHRHRLGAPGAPARDGLGDLRHQARRGGALHGDPHPPHRGPAGPGGAGGEEAGDARARATSPRGDDRPRVCSISPRTRPAWG